MELLEYLRIQTDCEYISDLSRCTRFYSIKNALCGLDVQQYSLKEWNDAAVYISGETVSFSRAEEAAEYLKNLSKKRSDKK